MNTEEKKPATVDMRIKLSLTIEGHGGPFEVERVVKLENIPGAWRIHGKDGEFPGTGGSRHEAVMDFLGKNYSSKKVWPEDVCAEFLKMLLERARPDQLERAAKIILNELER